MHADAGANVTAVRFSSSAAVVAGGDNAIVGCNQDSTVLASETGASLGYSFGNGEIVLVLGNSVGISRREIVLPGLRTIFVGSCDFGNDASVFI